MPPIMRPIIGPVSRHKAVAKVGFERIEKCRIKAERVTDVVPLLLLEKDFLTNH